MGCAVEGEGVIAAGYGVYMFGFRCCSVRASCHMIGQRQRVIDMRVDEPFVLRSRGSGISHTGTVGIGQLR